MCVGDSHNVADTSRLGDSMNISTIVTADVQGYIQGYRVAQLVNCLGTSGYRHYQSNEASILWSYHEETRELPGERNNARNNARCAHR